MMSASATHKGRTSASAPGGSRQQQVFGVTQHGEGRNARGKPPMKKRMPRNIPAAEVASTLPKQMCSAAPGGDVSASSSRAEASSTGASAWQCLHLSKQQAPRLQQHGAGRKRGRVGSERCDGHAPRGVELHHPGAAVAHQPIEVHEVERLDHVVLRPDELVLVVGAGGVGRASEREKEQEQEQRDVPGLPHLRRDEARWLAGPRASEFLGGALTYCKIGFLKIGNAHLTAFENAPKTAQNHPKPQRFLPQTVGLPGTNLRRRGWAPEALWAAGLAA